MLVRETGLILSSEDLGEIYFDTRHDALERAYDLQRLGEVLGRSSRVSLLDPESRRVVVRDSDRIIRCPQSFKHPDGKVEICDDDFKYGLIDLGVHSNDKCK